MSIFSPKQKEASITRLCDLFGFFSITNSEVLHQGYKAHNYLIEADHARYFLKLYHRLSHVVHEVKKSEAFFASQQIPVLLPIKDVHGRSAFMLGRTWCSLFPYVEGMRIESAHLTSTHLCALGTLTAQMHQCGAQADHQMFEPIHFWQHEQFLWEYHELMDRFHARAHLSELDQLMMHILEEKRLLVESFSIETMHIPRAHPVLIHGDLIYQNVFWDQDAHVTHVFDFEKTCVAPRAYECARSLMINCFDAGWGDDQFYRARLFLDAYRAISPFSFEEFLYGMRMYWMNVAHMTWLETKYLFSLQSEPSDVYMFHANRISHLKDDPKVFCERIYGTH